MSQWVTFDNYGNLQVFFQTLLRRGIEHVAIDQESNLVQIRFAQVSAIRSDWWKGAKFLNVLLEPPALGQSAPPAPGPRPKGRESPPAPRARSPRSARPKKSAAEAPPAAGSERAKKAKGEGSTAKKSPKVPASKGPQKPPKGDS